MIKLSKLNGKEILVNSDQIEYIETIPESKIVMMNGEYLLVTDSTDEIIDKVAAYKRRCYTVDEEMLRDALLASNSVQDGKNWKNLQDG